MGDQILSFFYTFFPFITIRYRHLNDHAGNWHEIGVITCRMNWSLNFIQAW